MTIKCISNLDCSEGCACVNGECVPIGDYYPRFSKEYLLDLILAGRITLPESKRLKEMSESPDKTISKMAAKLLYETK